MEHCYNRGCGKKFDPSSNAEDSCRYHPGEPFFHDAYKGWSCCNQKSVDFTTFLDFEPCARGKHSSVKRAEPEKKKVTIEKIEQNNKPKEMPRPCENDPMLDLTVKYTAAFEKYIKQSNQSKGNSSAIADNTNDRCMNIANAWLNLFIERKKN
ncbi:hypothetical protein ACOME3_001484 [Neoechinorhynchus agilis]